MEIAHDQNNYCPKFEILCINSPFSIETFSIVLQVNSNVRLNQSRHLSKFSILGTGMKSLMTVYLSSI